MHAVRLVCLLTRTREICLRSGLEATRFSRSSFFVHAVRLVCLLTRTRALTVATAVAFCRLLINNFRQKMPNCNCLKIFRLHVAGGILTPFPIQLAYFSHLYSYPSL
nr:MAG TPA: hypothetical protein [Caudoviricetes sp.]